MSLKSNAYKCMFYEREWTNMTHCMWSTTYTFNEW